MPTAVVTGAGRGLGRAIAGRLATRGLDVLVTDVDSRLAEESAADIGSKATAAALDVRDPAACREVAARASADDDLAVWVNNAGVLRTSYVWEQSDEEIELTVAANLLGVVNGCRAAVEAMRDAADGDRRILNVGSMASLTPSPGLAVYGATKQGILSFSVALQAELREARIPVEVRTICPATIDTGMVRERAGEREAAVLWSVGTSLLSTDQVADRALELLYGRRLAGSVPSPLGALLRLIDLAPTAGIRTLPALRRIGELNRRRCARSAAP